MTAHVISEHEDTETHHDRGELWQEEATEMAGRRTNKTGWIDQLPSKRWRARFAGPDGVRRAAPATFDTKMDAEAWLQRQARLVAAGTWQAETTQAGTFAAYAEEWLRERPLKPRTRAHYRRLLDKYLLPEYGSMPLDAITVAKVRAWHRGLDLAPTVKAHTYSLLRAILQTAWQDDLIESNPCRVRGASSAKRATTTTLPTPAQIAALADAMPSDKYRVAVLIASWCGLRFGELTEVRRKDLVVEDSVPVGIDVRRAVVRVDGEPIVQTPKSSAGIRRVGIPPHVREPLVAYLATLPDGPEALLFPASRTGAHIAPGSLYRVFYRARAAVGLPSLRWHDLRHFAATTAAQTGATLAEIQGFAGHSTTHAAMRYQHAAQDANARIAERMAGIAGA